MTEPQFFDLPGHIRFLDGYLDAVGRSLTTDREYVQIWLAPNPEADSDADAGMEWSEVRHWNIEFSAFAAEFLRLDPRSRLGFYLIDYLCWFREFTQGAICHRSRSGTDVYDIAYRFEWPDGARTRLLARRLRRDRATSDPVLGGRC